MLCSSTISQSRPYSASMPEFCPGLGPDSGVRGTRQPGLSGVVGHTLGSTLALGGGGGSGGGGCHCMCAGKALPAQANQTTEPTNKEPKKESEEQKQDQPNKQANKKQSLPFPEPVRRRGLFHTSKHKTDSCSHTQPTAITSSRGGSWPPRWTGSCSSRIQKGAGRGTSGRLHLLSDESSFSAPATSLPSTAS